MNFRKMPSLQGVPQFGIHIGGVYASRESSVVRTVLGSCIAVCLRDPHSEVGGMNHFMLPDGGTNSTSDDNTRYGIHAMELLINQCMKFGADRRNLEAKVFGGGHVLKVRVTDDNVPQRNIRFALEFLKTENIPIVSKDLGGYEARIVYFYTQSGRVRLKRLADAAQNSRELETIACEEREKVFVPPTPPDDDSNITLF